MSQMPPDLSKSYTTEKERADDREAILLYTSLIEVLVRLANRSPGSWSEEQKQLFPDYMPDIPPERTFQRLQRWIRVYNDEIKAIGDVRNRIVHSGTVTDPELRGAAYLARQTIASLFDMEFNKVNPIWSRQVIAKAARED